MADITSLKKQYDELIAQANEIKKKINEFDQKNKKIRIKQSNNIEFTKCINIFGKNMLNYTNIDRYYEKTNPPQYFEVHVFQNNTGSNYSTIAFRLFHVDTPMYKNKILVYENQQFSFSKNITNSFICNSWNTKYYYSQSNRPIIEYNDK